MAKTFLMQINKTISLLYGKVYGKIKKISRKTIIRKLNEGGLNFIDIKIHTLALKISWIVKLLNNPTRKWTSFCDYYLQLSGPSY